MTSTDKSVVALDFVPGDYTKSRRYTLPQMVGFKTCAQVCVGVDGCVGVCVCGWVGVRVGAHRQGEPRQGRCLFSGRGKRVCSWLHHTCPALLCSFVISCCCAS